MNEVSNCCGASISVETADEGTSCYVCADCGKACDAFHPKYCNRCGKFLETPGAHTCRRNRKD